VHVHNASCDPDLTESQRLLIQTEGLYSSLSREYDLQWIILYGHIYRRINNKRQINCALITSISRVVNHTISDVFTTAMERIS